MADLEPSPLENAWGRVTGLFGPGSAEVDPATGVSEQFRKQQMFQTFGNVGALLMAAGQKQMPAQRAQILAQMGQATSGPQEMLMKQQQLYQQQQARLAQQKLLAVQTQQAQQKLGESQQEQKERDVLRASMADPVRFKTTYGFDPSGMTPEVAQKIILQKQINDNATPTTWSITNAKDGAVIAVNPRDPSQTRTIQQGFQERPLTPEERASFGLKPDQAAMMTAQGPKVLGGGQTFNLGDSNDKVVMNRTIDRAFGAIDEANSAVGQIENSNFIRHLLDNNAISGFAADKVLMAEQALQALGFKPNDERVSNSQALVTAMAKRSLAAADQVQGQGALSNDERKLLSAAAGGQATLDPKAIRKVLELSDRYDRLRIDKGKKAAEALRGHNGIKGTGFEDQFTIRDPQEYQPSAAPTPTAPVAAQTPRIRIDANGELIQ